MVQFIYLIVNVLLGIDFTPSLKRCTIQRCLQNLRRISTTPPTAIGPTQPIHEDMPLAHCPSYIQPPTTPPPYLRLIWQECSIDQSSWGRERVLQTLLSCYQSQPLKWASQRLYGYDLGYTTVKSKTRAPVEGSSHLSFAAEIKLFHLPMKSWRQARHIIPAPNDGGLLPYKERLEDG